MRSSSIRTIGIVDMFLLDRYDAPCLLECFFHTFCYIGIGSYLALVFFLLILSSVYLYNPFILVLSVFKFKLMYLSLNYVSFDISRNTPFCDSLCHIQERCIKYRYTHFNYACAYRYSQYRSNIIDAPERQTDKTKVF